MVTKLEHALARADEGFRVFPLAPGAKKPNKGFMDFPGKATGDHATITKWWAEEFSPDCNIGIATGGRPGQRFLLVVDFDMKPGQFGAASMERMLLEDGIDTPYKNRTGSGGQHWYFWLPEGVEISGSSGALPGYPNVDIRCRGNLVAAEGSEFNGKAYTSISKGEIPIAPQRLIEIATSRNVASLVAAAAKNPLAEYDLTHNVDRAIHYLRNEAKPSIQDERGDDQTFKVACRLKDYAVSAPMSVELLWEHYNFIKCEPSWELHDIKRFAYSAARNGKLQPGIKTFEADFADEEPFDVPDKPSAHDLRPSPVAKEGEEAKKRRMFRVNFDEAAAKATAASSPSLIKDVLDQNSFAVLYGPSNSGKTFLALSWAYHIATGLEWAGKKATPGSVLYVVAEGGKGINKRIGALKQHYAPAVRPPLDIIPCPIDMKSTDKDSREIVDIANELAAENGQPLRLIVIDTLSRALAGGDENASTDMGAFVMNVDKIRSATSAAVLVVHHTGKNTANGARGWSGLRAASDTEIEVTDEKKIVFSKQRDMEMLKPMGFRLAGIDLGHDADGEPVNSCVLVATTEFDDPELDDLPPAIKDYFGALTDLGDGEFTFKEWDKSYASSCEETGAKAPVARTMRRWRETLEHAGWVSEKHERFSVKDRSQE